MIDLGFNLVDSLLWLNWCPLCFMVHFGGLAQAGREDGCAWLAGASVWGSMFKNFSICHAFFKTDDFIPGDSYRSWFLHVFLSKRVMTDDPQNHVLPHTALHSACWMRHAASLWGLECSSDEVCLWTNGVRPSAGISAVFAWNFVIMISLLFLLVTAPPHFVQRLEVGKAMMDPVPNKYHKTQSKNNKRIHRCTMNLFIYTISIFLHK